MNQTSRVIALNRLSAHGYELILERNGLDFAPGQLINLQGRDPLDSRSYSLASGIQDEVLTVLFRHIEAGVLTPQLLELRPGDPVAFSGPFGEFTLRDPLRPVFFFATGTGIAPARSYLRSYPGLNLTVFHGVRHLDDLYYRHEFESRPYWPHVSGDDALPAGMEAGRITAAVERLILPDDAHVYLCGANEMIYEVQEALLERGLPRENMFTEPYYYRFEDT